MRSELINNLATKLKNKGFESQAGRQAWGRLVEEIYPEVEKKAESYAKSKGEQFRVDASTLLSIGLYEGVKRALASWDIEKGDFMPRLLYMLPNVFMDHIRTEVLVDKRRTLITATSLSTPIDGDNIVLEDTLVDNDTCVESMIIPSAVTELLTSYSAIYGEEKAEIAKLVFLFDGSLESRNKAICKYYNVTAYSDTIRKRVERVKKHFKEFCQKNIQLILG